MKSEAEGEIAASKEPENILYMLGSTSLCNDFSHQPPLGSLRGSSSCNSHYLTRNPEPKQG